jgi:hypothetical protein
MRWAGHIACMGEMRVLVGKPEGKPPLARPRHKWGGVILKWIFNKWDG